MSGTPAECRVCKPCWELKYCPYGPLVEHFPGAPDHWPQTHVEEIYRGVLERFAAGEYKSEDEILSAIDHLLYHWPPQWQSLRNQDAESLQCNVFGHTCPVFLVWEPFTETKEGRKHSRYIPHDVMLKVVRRDGQICQACHKPVVDDDVEFDHIIPHSKGGPMSAENLRLVCRPCNRSKGDSLADLLYRRKLYHSPPGPLLPGGESGEGNDS